MAGAGARADAGGATSPDNNPSSSCSGDGGGGGSGGDHNSNNKVYKGVRKRKWGKWVSEIRLPNSRERIWLGSYDSPEKAARAFDAALYCLRGCRANFNFPDTPFNLDDINAADQSLTAQQIQLIAARFANNQEEQPSSRQDHHHHHHGVVGANSNNNSSPKSDSVMRENTYTATTASSSNSTTMHECDGMVVQVDHGDNIGEMDWTFLNDLGDSSTVIGSDHYHGLYSDDLDKMHSGELSMYATTTPFEDNDVDEIEGDDPFSNQPFLWNW